MLTAHQESHKRRLDDLEALIRKAVQTLSTVHGRARIDTEGQGACTWLLEKSLASLAVIREEVLAPFPHTCSCGSVYEEADWDELEPLGTQDDGDGGELDLRNCRDCGSTRSIPLRKPAGTDTTRAA